MDPLVLDSTTCAHHLSKFGVVLRFVSNDTAGVPR